MPKVSVIVPTYNRCRYLKEAIESILKQSFTDFEIIISDNASTDNTTEVIKSIEDTRLFYYRSEVNIGITPNYNKALQLSKGEYIQLFSDDDIMLDNCLLDNVSVLDKITNVDLTHSDINIIDGDGNITSNNHWGTEIWKKWAAIHNESKMFSKEVYQKYLYKVHNLLCMPTVMMRRKVFEKLKYFDPTLKFILDWEYWLRASVFYNFYYINKKLVSYRMHEGSTTTEVNHLLIKELRYAKDKLQKDFPNQLVVQPNYLIDLAQEIFFYSDYNYWRLLRHFVGKSIADFKTFDT